MDDPTVEELQRIIEDARQVQRQRQDQAERDGGMDDPIVRGWVAVGERREPCKANA